jgi:hypothetical protein
MGYYSNVAVTMKKANYEKMVEEMRGKDDDHFNYLLEEMIIHEKPGYDYVQIELNSVRWYENDPKYFPEVDFVMNYLRQLGERDETYHIARIGEDPEDFEVDYHMSDDIEKDGYLYDYVPWMERRFRFMDDKTSESI